MDFLVGYLWKIYGKSMENLWDMDFPIEIWNLIAMNNGKSMGKQMENGWEFSGWNGVSYF
jgi:hypothetical protein